MNFLSSESGAVTVDWVVLTAALVGLGLATMSVVSGGVASTSEDIETQLTSPYIIQTAFYAADVVGVAKGSSPSYSFATPRCAKGSTPDTCYSVYTYDVDLETADGEIITVRANERNKSSVEWDATFTDKAGESVDPSTLNFGDVDCISTDGYGGSRDVCLSSVT